jgi:hypothetical protein
MRHKRTRILAAGFALILPARVSAQDVAPPPPDRWEVAFTPYLWVAGTDGDIGIPRGTGEVEVDKSFADILGSLNFAFMGTFDVRYERIVAMADVIYLDMTAEVEGIRDPQFFEGEVDQSVLVSTLAVGYRVVDGRRFSIDLLAGGRLVALDTKIQLEGPLNNREADRSVSNLSPMVGARARLPLNNDLALVLYVDGGGFGASDVKWQAAGTVQWDISSHWRLLGGYRHMAIHHDENDYEFDVGLSGPLVGVSYRF